MLKKINYLVQAIFIYLFFLIGRILGINLSRKIFSFIFLNLGPLFKSKKIIKENLRVYSQNISNYEEKKIIDGMWKNYGMTFIEYIHLDKLKKNGKILINGEENLLKVLKTNKPVIFISGHFANFELMSMTITKKQIPLATIYRPLNNLFLNPFMEYLRKKFICKNQIKKGINGVRDTIEYIKNNHCIALMIDQRVSEGEKINFFGKPALTTTLPAQLSIKYNLGILPVFIERKNNDRFEVQFQAEINPKNFENKIELSKKLNEVLEKMIVKNPTQWIWSHNRWK
tara:strand:+ start:1282 stop:2136 length:855 start_codon:yes stop_codon:yes gene_type:complete